jgi:hypothetical protein
LALMPNIFLISAGIVVWHFSDNDDLGMFMGKNYYTKIIKEKTKIVKKSPKK